MPSCEQSAPARYEFRGGVEAYCMAAAKHMVDAPTSRFVVCEGWLSKNHTRVKTGAKESGLRLLREVRVLGREDKVPLFAVYEMGLAKYHGKQDGGGEVGCEVEKAEAKGGSDETVQEKKGQESDAACEDEEDHVIETVAVRHVGGKRTEAYVKLMHEVGMPSYEDE
jgi:hypothetical protein